jgi:hypothetical protein
MRPRSHRAEGRCSHAEVKELKLAFPDINFLKHENDSHCRRPLVVSGRDKGRILPKRILKLREELLVSRGLYNVFYRCSTISEHVGNDDHIVIAPMVMRV